MKKAEAKRIAEDITREQMATMFARAMADHKDWRKPSPVNKSISMGKAWNILYRAFAAGLKLPLPTRINIVWTFGDYLDENLKPPKQPKIRREPENFCHEEPMFDSEAPR